MLRSLITIYFFSRRVFALNSQLLGDATNFLSVKKIAVKDFSTCLSVSVYPCNSNKVDRDS